MSDTNDYTQLVYGNESFAVEDLPVGSRHILMQRGLSHVLGNEVSARVVAWTRKHTTDTSTPTVEAIAAAKAGFYSAALAAIRSGDLAVSVRGPRGPADPIGDHALALATAEVVAAAQERNFKLSAKDIAAKASAYFAARENHFRDVAAKAMARAARSTDESLAALFG